MAIPTFNWQADYSAKVGLQPRVLTATFGDGYEQRAQDGINNNPQTWNISITRDFDTVFTAKAFLDSMDGVTSFWWGTPEGFAYRFVCRKYDAQYPDFNKATLTATFEQVFLGGTPPVVSGVLNDSGLIG